MQIKNVIRTAVAVALLFPLASCLDDDKNKDYTEWKEKNETFVLEQQYSMKPDGTYVYERVAADWAADIYVLMKWHNDRSLTEKNLVPLDNSTVDVKYQVMTMDSVIVDSSYAKTDSVYTSQPYKNIPGFWLALTNMHVGDSVTVIIPWRAAYGSTGSGDIKPYSTLIFDMKLKGISSYQTPS